MVWHKVAMGLPILYTLRWNWSGWRHWGRSQMHNDCHLTANVLTIMPPRLPVAIPPCPPMGPRKIQSLIRDQRELVFECSNYYIRCQWRGRGQGWGLYTCITQVCIWRPRTCCSRAASNPQVTCKIDCPPTTTWQGMLPLTAQCHSSYTPVYLPHVAHHKATLCTHSKCIYIYIYIVKPLQLTTSTDRRPPMSTALFRSQMIAHTDIPTP